MRRASHKKSRGGCLECKRRHIKCDERAGGCGNCVAVERHCQYPNRSAAATPQTAPLTTTRVESQPGLLGFPRIGYVPDFVIGIRDRFGEPAVNLNHMELIIHFSLAIVVPEIERDFLEYGTRLILQASLEAPYLLHEVLAFSSRHLSVTNLPKSDFYLHLAKDLQSRSFSLFKASQLQIDRSTCMPLLLYSSLLGRHLLVDVLVSQMSRFDLFLDQFVQYMHVHRGVKAIASESWPLLIESKLMPILKWGAPPADLTPKGRECRELKRLLQGLSDLGPASIADCQSAVDLLQVGFDQLNEPPIDRNPYSLTFNWPILIPEGYLNLLEQARPEAIAILGYYAILLNRSRDNWQIADGGIRLLHGVSQHLGSAFEAWLAWPQEVLSNT
ncbi:hypothetical protein B0O99DRAFT_636515 [Bisporella sp. PMI_857]|nr:hypothetical protein B0O99DRAFT_636515 [Bisporella sp. PMI_857]